MSLTRSVLPDAHTISENVRRISVQFSQERRVRQRRQELVASDFDRLRDAGFLLTAVPVEQGGIWANVARSTRALCEMLRTLAHGDSSVALVCAMHPAVFNAAGWLTTPVAPPPFQEAWAEQRRRIFQTVLDGAWWGTITSEPGSGGDIAKTKAIARPSSTGGEYRITGQKHFGSGSGITSYMITLAVPAGETEPDWFFLDLRGVPWDGSAGVDLLAAWDGHGMRATQSHAMQFVDFPATRVAWPGMLQNRGTPAGFVPCAFSAVIVGSVETAIATARQQLALRQASLRPYEQVEWSRVELEGWLIHQAYEGMLRATEDQGGGGALQGKTAIAELAESALGRICRILGGGAYSRHSPFGFWFEDVRALGFLRPPWGLAYDRLFDASWDAPA